MKGAVDDAVAMDHMNAVFADPRDEFSGKAVCGNPEDVNGIVATGYAKADAALPNPSMKSFHPKVAGATLYAQVADQTLSGS